MSAIGSTRGRSEKCIHSFWFENVKKRDRSDDVDVDGRIILEWILGKYCGDFLSNFSWLLKKGFISWSELIRTY